MDTSFELFFDTDYATDQIASLRGDATSTTPISLPPLPQFGPVAALSAALTEAVNTTNSQAELLAREAHRVAEIMEIFTAGALHVDAAAARNLEGVRP